MKPLKPRFLYNEIFGKCILPMRNNFLYAEQIPSFKIGSGWDVYLYVELFGLTKLFDLFSLTLLPFYCTRTTSMSILQLVKRIYILTRCKKLQGCRKCTTICYPLFCGLVTHLFRSIWKLKEVLQIMYLVFSVIES